MSTFGKLYECSYCKKTGLRQDLRVHIKKEHKKEWRDSCDVNGTGKRVKLSKLMRLVK